MNIHSKYDLIPYLYPQRQSIQDQNETSLSNNNQQNKDNRDLNIEHGSSNRLKYYVKTDNDVTIYNEKRVVQEEVRLAKGTLIDTYA